MRKGEAVLGAVYKKSCSKRRVKPKKIAFIESQIGKGTKRI